MQADARDEIVPISRQAKLARLTSEKLLETIQISDVIGEMTKICASSSEVEVIRDEIAGIAETLLANIQQAKRDEMSDWLGQKKEESFPLVLSLEAPGIRLDVTLTGPLDLNGLLGKLTSGLTSGFADGVQVKEIFEGSEDMNPDELMEALRTAFAQIRSKRTGRADSTS